MYDDREELEEASPMFDSWAERIGYGCGVFIVCTFLLIAAAMIVYGLISLFT